MAPWNGHVTEGTTMAPWNGPNKELLAQKYRSIDIMKIIQQRQRHWIERTKGERRRMQMLHMLAKDGYLALEQEAEVRWRWSHR